MKKDILAAITFLATGLLFYAVQTDVQTEDALKADMECSGAEATMVEENIDNVKLTLSIEDLLPRDS